jgi:hydroxymethylglutaryl-CoA reductase
MKTEKFNLSDLEMHDKHGSGYLYTEQVKEFIKRLKEEATSFQCSGNYCNAHLTALEVIDKLAGKELVFEK